MINDNLKLSRMALNFLKELEVLKLRPYDDTNGKSLYAWNKHATIGYGHLIMPYEWDRFRCGIDNANAEQVFLNDLAPREAVVKTLVLKTLSQNQYDALVILVFNIGKPAFEASSVLKMINDPRAVTNYATIESAWKSFNKQRINGALVKKDGLVNRRNAEWNIWEKSIYERW